MYSVEEELGQLVVGGNAEAPCEASRGQGGVGGVGCVGGPGGVGGDVEVHLLLQHVQGAHRPGPLMVWYGMVRYGTVRYGTVWYGMVWYRASY